MTLCLTYPKAGVFFPSILSHMATHFCLLLPQVFASSFTDLCQYLTVLAFERIFLCWNSELGQLSKWPGKHIERQGLAVTFLV